MNILLDTHAVLWFLEGSEKMGKVAVDTIHSAENNKYISVATLWEVAIKLSIGKMEFEGGIEGFIQSTEDNGFLQLGVSSEHIKRTAGLPFIHRDPFDRMLVAQAMAENMVLMTVDNNILKYDIECIW